MNRVGRIVLGTGIVVGSIALGLLLAVVVVTAIPGYEIMPGVFEGTPVQVMAFVGTFVVVTAFSLVLAFSWASSRW